MKKSKTEVELIKRSGLEARPQVVVVVMGGVIFVYDTLNVTKLLDMTRDINWTIVMKSVLFLCFFQQFGEEGMINVHYRYYELLLFLSLTYQYRNTTSWDVLQFILMMMMMKVKWHMNMEIQMMMVFFSAPHSCLN